MTKSMNCRSRVVLAVVPVVCLLLPCSHAAWGQWEQVQKLAAADATEGDWLGVSSCVNAGIAILGAHGDDDNGADSGSAYIYRNDGLQWIQESKLLPFDGAAGDYFGLSVSVSDCVAVVGAPYDDDKGADAGSAYVFRHDGTDWMLDQKLLAFDGLGGERFGHSVCISGDAIVVGTYRMADPGAAYIYRFHDGTWNLEAALSPPGTSRFGYSVSIAGDVAVIGANNDDDNGSGSGAAYIFRFDSGTWFEEQKLSASDGAPFDRFGVSVCVSGTVAIVGAYADDDNGSSSGSAYVYRFDGSCWLDDAKLVPSDGSDDDQFGISVSVREDLAVIGAYYDNDNGSESGSAYIYRYCGIWDEETKLLPSDGLPDDRFGISVSVDEEFALVGSIWDDDAGAESGSAYVFQMFCRADMNGDEKVDLADILAVLAAWGDCGQCPEDINDDGVVDIDDVFAVLAAWGPCP